MANAAATVSSAPSSAARHAVPKPRAVTVSAALMARSARQPRLGRHAYRLVARVPKVACPARFAPAVSAAPACAFAGMSAAALVSIASSRITTRFVIAVRSTSRAQAPSAGAGCGDERSVRRLCN
jgi:hypothetical protein